MPATSHYLAIDLGASSGRAVLGSFDGQMLALRELHRFPNSPVERAGGLHWDARGLFRQVKESLRKASHAGPLAGIGVDTWGVDYGLISEAGELVTQPYHYRDPRTRAAMTAALKEVPREVIYARTGIQFLPFNTLFQLMADRLSGDDRLTSAHTLLFMPDLFHFWLTGQRRTEHSIASTSQMYDPATGAWADDLLRALSLPRHILPKITEAGTQVGTLLPDLASETGVGPIPVIAPASHDTAAAVAAVPAVGSDWAYISSGTWSLVGRELSAPIRTPEALAANFTNERGIAGTIRFHKNVTGLWLLQECQRVWAMQDRAYTFEHLCDLALASPSFAGAIDPDGPSFAEFGDMPARIRSFCASTGQASPGSDGALARCIFESLALKCRVVIETLERLTSPVRTIHIVGGGAQNHVLCQFIASATSRPVLAGPVEATAAGNVMTQARAHRGATSLAQIRQVITASFRPTLYEPRDAGQWADASARFHRLLNLDPQSFRG